LAKASALEISVTFLASSTANGAALSANGAWSREYEEVISGSEIRVESGPSAVASSY